ncbi:hypothetical protein TNCV_392241 [Trichonephila clavipes]|nr:hypothetical protein TNCV_392241 [Trichonephila clavipes]
MVNQNLKSDFRNSRNFDGYWWNLVNWSRSSPACGFSFPLEAQPFMRWSAEIQSRVRFGAGIDNLKLNCRSSGNFAGYCRATAIYVDSGTGLPCKRRDAKSEYPLYFETVDPNIQSNTRNTRNYAK